MKTKLAKVGNVSGKSVAKHTGRDWDEWITLLNKEGCVNWTHQEIVSLLKRKFKLRLWWQQQVARGFQIAMGIRMPEQTLKGTYTTTATKTYVIAAKKMYTWLMSIEGQGVWLKPLVPVQFVTGLTFECRGGVYGECKKITPYKLLRLLWHDEDWPKKTTVELRIYSRRGKIMVVIDHKNLPTLKAKQLMHARWRQALDEISACF